MTNDKKDNHSKKCFQSERIYLDELSKKYGQNFLMPLLKTFAPYNSIKMTTYNFLYNETFLGDEELGIREEVAVRQLFGVDNYYANNIVIEAKALVDSQKELAPLYKDQIKSDIKAIKTKIKTTKAKITQFETNQKQIIKYYRLKKQGKSTKRWEFKNYPYAHHGFKDYNRMEFFTYYDESIDIYGYSCFVDQELKKLRNKKRQLNFALNKLNQKLKKVNTPKRVCFGGKKLFKSKDTTDISYEEWIQALYENKYDKMLHSGRLDNQYGNETISYDYVTHDFEIELLKSYNLKNGQKIVTKNMKEYFTIPNVKFPHGQEEIDEYLKKQRKIVNNKSLPKCDRKYLPIAYLLSIHKDKNERYYLIITAILTLPKKQYVNDYTSVGVVSIDINVDHIALTELDSCGNLIHDEILPYDITNRKKGSINHELSRIASAIIAYCKKAKKCLVMEDLDFTKKKQQLKYKNKRYNQMITSFAYKKLTEYITSKAYRNDIHVYKVDPKYTSFIAKVKYMRLFGLSIHICAAYVIGRRGMGLRESVPSYLKHLLTEEEKNYHHIQQYKVLISKLSSIKKHCYYQDLKNIDNLLTA